MKVLNMTPHQVTVYFINPKTGETERIVNIPPSGEILRLEEEDMETRELTLDLDDGQQIVVPVKVRKYHLGDLLNKLSQFAGQEVAVIVSSMIIQSLEPQVFDALRRKGIYLIAPDSSKGAIRNTQGVILGVTGFVTGGNEM